MSAQHTPGPWSGGKDIPVRAFDTEALGFSIIYINTGSSARKEVSMANARLIGAAPEMLAALRRAVLALAFASESSAAMRDDYEAVSRAIAKATGSAA